MKLRYDFEHQMWKQLKQHGFDSAQEFNLAISGGLDSMVLLEVIRVLRPEARLKVLHFHHGDLPLEQKKDRDAAVRLVREACGTIKNSEFISEKSSVELFSEDDMRKARWQFLRAHYTKTKAIVTAHHRDDWVETLILKMLRGTAETGLLAFQVWNNEIFRPFLHTSKVELRDYATQRNLKWCEDSSNQSTDYLRNWLRQSWFSDLEDRVPGGYQNFSRSLLHLIDELQLKTEFKLQFYQDEVDLGLDRAWYLALPDRDQLKALALFLKTKSSFSMTRGQLEEIQKRLDKNQNDFTFEIIRKWVIKRSQIMLM